MARQAKGSAGDSHTQALGAVARPSAISVQGCRMGHTASGVTAVRQGGVRPLSARGRGPCQVVPTNACLARSSWISQRAESLVIPDLVEVLVSAGSCTKLFIAINRARQPLGRA